MRIIDSVMLPNGVQPEAIEVNPIIGTWQRTSEASTFRDWIVSSTINFFEHGLTDDPDGMWRWVADDNGNITLTHPYYIRTENIVVTDTRLTINFRIANVGHIVVFERVAP